MKGVRRPRPLREPLWSIGALVAAALAVGMLAVLAVGLLAIPASRATQGGGADRGSAGARAGGEGNAADAERDADADADAVEILQSEVDALLAAGVPADDPKVAPLEADLATLASGAARARQPGEPGLDLSSVLGTPPGRGARSAAVDGSSTAAATSASADTATAWDRGLVDCEPVPPNMLTVADLAGARCASVPQPDGSGRYVALAPGGTLRVVRFDRDGSLASATSVTREPDRHVDGVPSSLDGVGLSVDGSGDLVITVAGAPGPRTIDVG